MASSVHDHFGTYHFSTGVLTNLKSGPLRYMISSVYSEEYHFSTF